MQCNFHVSVICLINFCYIIFTYFFNEYILTVSLLPKCFKFLFMWIWKLVIWFFIFTLRSEVENFQLQWLLRAWKEQRLGVDQVQCVYNQKNISQSAFLRLLQASERFLMENWLDGFKIPFYKGIFTCCLQMSCKSNREILLIYIILGILFDVYKQHYLCKTGLLLFSSNYMNVWTNSQLNYMAKYFYHLRL